MPPALIHPSDPPDRAPEYLRASDAAAFVGLSVGHMANARSAGTGARYFRVGSTRIVYAVADLRAWVAAGAVQPDAA